MEYSRRLYERILKFASYRHAAVYLGGLSFSEAIFLPIPPDFLLIPMVLANKAKAWYFAGVTTASSVLGGVVGYLIGVYLYESVGKLLIDLYGLGEYFGMLRIWYDEYGIWVVLLSGFLPIPYKVFTIASGVFAMAMLPFIIGSAIGRATRFYAVSGVCYWAGDSIDRLMKNIASPIAWIFSLLLIVGLVYWTIQ